MASSDRVFRRQRTNGSRLDTHMGSEYNVNHVPGNVVFFFNLKLGFKRAKRLKAKMASVQHAFRNSKNDFPPSLSFVVTSN